MEAPTLAATPALVDVNAAAEVLGVSPQMVRKLISNGQLAAVRVGTAVRLQQAEVLAFIDSGGSPTRNT
jgi:excisionase family DNA binding protein